MGEEIRYGFCWELMGVDVGRGAGLEIDEKGRGLV
jgi:hypothetical protein